MDDLPPFLVTKSSPSAAKTGPANEPTEADLIALLETLRQDHRKIDEEIKTLSIATASDILKVKRMKKVKLAMKDRILFIENQLTPDIIA